MRKIPAAHPAHPPPDPGHPPLTPATIRDPDLLRATLQDRAPTTPLGWYRLQEDCTKLTVKALQDLTTSGSGLHEAIVDLVLWRARKHTQGQHFWIPPIEWGQALTHDTGINVTRQGSVLLRRAPAEMDQPADPNHPEQWEQATAPTRDTALRAAGLRTPDDDLPPPPTDSDHPPYLRTLSSCDDPSVTVLRLFFSPTDHWIFQTIQTSRLPIFTRTCMPRPSFIF